MGSRGQRTALPTSPRSFSVPTSHHPHLGILTAISHWTEAPRSPQASCSKAVQLTEAQSSLKCNGSKYLTEPDEAPACLRDDTHTLPSPSTGPRAWERAHTHSHFSPQASHSAQVCQPVPGACWKCWVVDGPGAAPANEQQEAVDSQSYLAGGVS